MPPAPMPAAASVPPTVESPATVESAATAESATSVESAAAAMSPAVSAGGSNQGDRNDDQRKHQKDARQELPHEPFLSAYKRTPWHEVAPVIVLSRGRGTKRSLIDRISFEVGRSDPTGGPP